MNSSSDFGWRCTMQRLLLLWIGLVALGLSALSPARADAPIAITDIAGRTVKLERPAQRILLGEGRQLLALSLIHPDPVSILAGWPSDLSRQDASTYARYREKYPAIDSIPVVGQGSLDTFSVEKAIASKPDVAIFSGGYGPSAKSTDIIARLESAGIPVVFVDFVGKPLENTAQSVTILGQVIGREKEAEAYVAF